MLRLLFLAVSLVAAATISTTTAQAQGSVTPMPGTGCPGESAPTVPGGRPPSRSMPWQLACTSPGACTGARAIIIGVCSPAIPLSPPLGCLTGCSLVVNPSYGSFPDPTNVFPPSLPVGFVICAQCACINATCVNISDGVTLVIGP